MSSFVSTTHSFADYSSRNRKSENLLRELEIAATIASVVGYSTSSGKKAPYFYPKSAIDQLWQSVSVCHALRRVVTLSEFWCAVFCVNFTTFFLDRVSEWSTRMRRR